MKQDGYTHGDIIKLLKSKYKARILKLSRFTSIRNTLLSTYFPVKCEKIYFILGFYKCNDCILLQSWGLQKGPNGQPQRNTEDIYRGHLLKENFFYVFILKVLFPYKLYGLSPFHYSRLLSLCICHSLCDFSFYFLMLILSLISIAFFSIFCNVFNFIYQIRVLFNYQSIHLLYNYQPFPSPGDLPNSGIKPRSPSLKVDSLPAESQGKPKNIGVGSLSLLQRIFSTQELYWGLLHCRWILYQLSYQGSPSLSI